MPTPTLQVPHRPASGQSAAKANDAIRRFVANRRSWSREELAELDRLRAVWRQAGQNSSTEA